MATDPVCGMTVEEKRAVAMADYQGTAYYFCSHGCQKAFAAEPEKYVTKKDTRNPSGVASPHFPPR